MKKLLVLLVSAIFSVGISFSTLAYADQIVKFGVRNIGSVVSRNEAGDLVQSKPHYTLAGGHPDLINLEFMADGTAVAEMSTSKTFDPGSVSIHLEGDLSTKYRIVKFLNNHIIEFTVPDIDPNSVVVLVIDGSPPPKPGPNKVH